MPLDEGQKKFLNLYMSFWHAESTKPSGHCHDNAAVSELITSSGLAKIRFEWFGICPKFAKKRGVCKYNMIISHA